jgi:putative DNA primase/helicase
VVADEHRYNPLRDYLTGLEWDGEDRLSTWLTQYLGVKPSNIVAAVGRAWMIGAVARALDPGCQLDTMLVLEGPQGTKKTSALRNLVGAEWYGSGPSANLAAKDCMIDLQGPWILEWAELDQYHKNEQSVLKHFLSKRDDRFRPPYGKTSVKHPRSCAFAGSINVDTWMQDATGGRRFWPVRCGDVIAADELGRDRDQLWAEAVYRYRDDEPWWLREELLQRAAEEQQAQRFDADVWHELIEAFLIKKSSLWLSSTPGEGAAERPPLLVTIAECLGNGDCIDKRKDQWTDADKKRVVRSLLHLRWKRVRASKPNSDGVRPWGYTPSADAKTWPDSPPTAEQWAALQRGVDEAA